LVSSVDSIDMTAVAVAVVAAAACSLLAVMSGVASKPGLSTVAYHIERQVVLCRSVG
jgi:hypothetical protein